MCGGFVVKQISIFNIILSFFMNGLFYGDDADPNGQHVNGDSRTAQQNICVSVVGA